MSCAVIAPPTVLHLLRAFVTNGGVVVGPINIFFANAEIQTPSPLVVRRLVHDGLLREGLGGLELTRAGRRAFDFALN